MLIRIAGTVSESIVDGPGIRYTIFTQGCPHHCEGCHNPETHDFGGALIQNYAEGLVCNAAYIFHVGIVSIGSIGALVPVEGSGCRPFASVW